MSVIQEDSEDGDSGKKILPDSMVFEMNNGKIPKRSKTHKKSLRDRLEKIMGKETNSSTKKGTNDSSKLEDLSLD